MTVVTPSRPDARPARRRQPRRLGWLPGGGPRRTSATGPFYVALVLLLVFSLAPLLVFVGNAFKTQVEIGEDPLGWPSSFRFDNFAEAWSTGGLATGLRNSTIIVLATVAGVCVIAGCAAYALARLRLPGGNGVLLYLLVASALPFQAFLVPLFFLWSKLLLYDSLFGLVVIYWAVFSPFATLLLRSYLLTLPRELEDAARLDGAGELQVLRRVVLPLAWPGFLTVALVTGLATWNEFLFAITFLQNPDLLPIVTGFLQFQQSYTQNYALVSAAGVIMLLPMLVLFLALQRRFVAGLTATGLKG
jgi:raffinose/stachyose/melibiose transport system permease protein